MAEHGLNQVAVTGHGDPEEAARGGVLGAFQAQSRLAGLGRTGDKCERIIVVVTGAGSWGLVHVVCSDCVIAVSVAAVVGPWLFLGDGCQRWLRAGCTAQRVMAQERAIGAGVI